MVQLHSAQPTPPNQVVDRNSLIWKGGGEADRDSLLNCCTIVPWVRIPLLPPNYFYEDK